MSHKHCINCEAEIGAKPCETQSNKPINDDFCSNECLNEYENNADPQLVSRSAEANQDALPVFNTARAGILPPNSIEAISALLQTTDSQKLKHAVDSFVKNSQPIDSEPK